MNGTTRQPFVYWAQDKHSVSLRVDVRNAEEVSIVVAQMGRLLEFAALGNSSSSSPSSSSVPLRHKFAFELALHAEVRDQPALLKVDECRVEIRLAKREPAFWASGILSAEAQQKAHKWLKFDFERWKDDSADEAEEAEAKQKQQQEEQQPYGGGGHRGNPYLENLLRELEQDNKMGGNNTNVMSEEEFAQYAKLMNSSYLFIYNCGMFIANFYLLCSLLLKLFVSMPKDEFIAQFWPANFQTMFLITVFQLMEVLHALSGMTTNAGYRAPLLQVFGRLFMLMIIHGCAPCQGWQPVFSLIFVYLLSEQFRYPYYALNTLCVSPRWLAWLRYNAWILLYPAGLTLEGLILLRSIPHYYSSGIYSLRLPNALNFAFNFGVLLAFLTFTCFPFIAFTLLQHMAKQRRTKMGELQRMWGGKKKTKKH